jgi:6-phosphogluconolactonase
VNTKAEIQVYDGPQEVAEAAAALFVSQAQQAIAERGVFHAVLSGGTTPAQTYGLLATATYSQQVDWDKVHVWLGDERAVAPDHPQSNFAMIHRSLLAHCPLPEAQVHRWPTEQDWHSTPQLYESALRAAFPGQSSPRFDLVFLGLGEDGHTASLFPHTTALQETRAWCVANPVPQLNTLRFTLTYLPLNAARHIAFLVTGGSKQQRLRSVLYGDYGPLEQPAQAIQPSEGLLRYMVDSAAWPTTAGQGGG